MSESNKRTNLVNIATSIFPSRIEQQQEAVATWINHGFNILSVNSREEISRVRHLFPDITFVETTNNSAVQPNPPYVAINSLLDTLLQAGSPICGIINSDVLLCAKTNFYQVISSEASSSLIYGARTDIDPLTDTKILGKFGLDYFFFPASFICIYPQANFYLGQPCWDYWFPLIVAFHGFPLKRLEDPIAFHYIHEIKWGANENKTYGAELLRSLRGAIATSVDDPFIRNLYKIVSNGGLAELFSVSHSYLRAYVPWLYCNTDTDLDKLLIARQSLDELKMMLVESEKRELLLLSSKSWRLTKPFRVMRRLFFLK